MTQMRREAWAVMAVWVSVVALGLLTWVGAVYAGGRLLGGW